MRGKCFFKVCEQGELPFPQNANAEQRGVAPASVGGSGCCMLSSISCSLLKKTRRGVERPQALESEGCRGQSVGRGPGWQEGSPMGLAA